MSSLGKGNSTACCYKKAFIFVLISVVFMSLIVFRSFLVQTFHPPIGIGVEKDRHYMAADDPTDGELLVEHDLSIDKDEENMDTYTQSMGEIRHPGFNVSYLNNTCAVHSSKVDGKNFDLRVFVFTYNRAASVKRLLASLNNAKYGNSSVILEVWVDRSEDGSVHQETLETVREFQFDRGMFRVCVHSAHVGIIGQWLIPWKPKEDSREIAVLLEDDMTVSPYFYKYLQNVHSKYRYLPKVNGFALQGISMKHNGEHGMVDVSSKERVYLYPTLGTWGFSPNAKNWRHFLRWFEKTYPNPHFVPRIPNHVGSGWYLSFMQERKEDSFWEMWHIYHAWSRREWTLYPNFPGHKGLTFNWKENGLHYRGQSITNKHEDQKHLLLEWKPDFEILPYLPAHVDNGGVVLPL